MLLSNRHYFKCVFFVSVLESGLVYLLIEVDLCEILSLVVSVEVAASRVSFEDFGRQVFPIPRAMGPLVFERLSQLGLP